MTKHRAELVVNLHDEKQQQTSKIDEVFYQKLWIQQIPNVWIYQNSINFLAEILLMYLVAPQKTIWQTKEELGVSRLHDTKTAHSMDSTRAKSVSFLVF